MTTGQFILERLITFVLLTSVTITHAEESSCKLRSEQAFKILAGQIKKDRLYESRLAESCYSYRVSNCSSKTIFIELHEIHNNQCGGDPLTTHVLDRYSVNTKTKHIEWYYAPEGEYVPYKKTRIKGGCPLWVDTGRKRFVKKISMSTLMTVRFV